MDMAALAGKMETIHKHDPAAHKLKRHESMEMRSEEDTRDMMVHMSEDLRLGLTDRDLLKKETGMITGLKCTILEARQYLLMAHLDLGDAIDLFIKEHNSTALLSVPAGQHVSIKNRRSAVAVIKERDARTVNLANREAPGQVLAAEKRLCMACAHGDATEVKALLAGGVDPGSRDVAGGNCSALHYAAEFGWPVCAELLCQAGADLESVDDWHLCTPFLWAMWNAKVTVAQVLIFHGCNPVRPTPPPDSTTPFHPRLRPPPLTAVPITAGCGGRDRPGRGDDVPAAGGQGDERGGGPAADPGGQHQTQQVLEAHAQPA